MKALIFLALLIAATYAVNLKKETTPTLLTEMKLKTQAVENCLTNTTVCIKCAQNYTRTLEGQCVEECDPDWQATFIHIGPGAGYWICLPEKEKYCAEGYYLNDNIWNGECLPCANEYCAKCFEKPDSCSSCKKGNVFFRKLFRCGPNVNVCPDGWVADFIETNSTDLTQGYFECFPKCRPGWFENEKHECERCHTDCATCFDIATNCLTCTDKKKVQFSLECLPDCLEGTFQRLVKVEYDNSFRFEPWCDICSCSCRKCYGPKISMCTKCKNGRKLHNGYCVANCPSNTYERNGECYCCDKTCLTCSNSGPTKCKSCIGARVFYVDRQSRECRLPYVVTQSLNV